MLLDKTVKEFLDDLAAGTPAPGAGSTAALAGAMGACLIAMVCRVTLENRKYADSWDAVREPLEKAAILQQKLAALAEEDIFAYQAFVDALKLPRDTDEQREIRKTAIQTELRHSTEVPLMIACKCREVLEIAFPAAAHGAEMAAGDIGTGALLAEAGRKGAFFSIKANLPLIKDTDFVRNIENRMIELESGIEDLHRKVFLMVESRLVFH